MSTQTNAAISDEYFEDILSFAPDIEVEDEISAEELAELGDDLGQEIVSEVEVEEEVETEVDEAELTAAVTVAEAYEGQEVPEVITSEADTLTVEAEGVKAAKKARVFRKTVAGAAKSEVIRERLGEKEDEFVLVVSDATLDGDALKLQRQAIYETIDKMAVKVGEKAVNLIGAVNSGAKLSAYTQIAVKLLDSSPEGITTKELIDHLQDQKANGIKSYSQGTANSQAHQMFKLLPELKIGIMEGRVMKANPESLLLVALRDII